MDIVGVLRGSDNYAKNRNYRKYLKAKLKREGCQPGSVTTRFKFIAPDGKKHAANVLDYNGIIELAKNFPSKQANRFIEWFTYSGESIDGRSARIWIDLILKKRLRLCVDWSKINKDDYLNAMRKSPSDSTKIKALLKSALTDKINDREVFMTGVDYSYYYEQDDMTTDDKDNP